MVLAVAAGTASAGPSGDRGRTVADAWPWAERRADNATLDALRTPSHVTWQLFLDEYDVSDAVRRAVVRLVDRLNDRDPVVRDRATEALRGRLVVAVLKVAPELADLSPEQQLRLQYVRRKARVLTPTQVDRLRRNVRFLTAAMANADERLRLLIARRLSELASVDMADDAIADGG
jgi:hypothetical protein